MAKEHTHIDYEALVAADKAMALLEPTVEQVVRDNLEHFEGFARASAKQSRAVKMVAESTNCDPESIRRTFLKVYGRWDAFSHRMRTDAPNSGPLALSIDVPPINPTSNANKVWE